MSDIMRCINFKYLIEWCLEEYRTNKTIFGIHEGKFYINKSKKKYKTIFGDEISSPIGPAAGPHSQLAQNIIAAYLTGARFIELKTVQIIDGEQIREAVKKPCILAEDECYNCEWSTELKVEEAFDEYVKAYFAIILLSKELGIADSKDFTYNMSVGYDYKGIRDAKIDNYIEGLKDASNTEIYKECYKYISDKLGDFTAFTNTDLQMISPEICNSITLSTLHGCPSEEIEKISKYLLEEKKLNTFVKFNPTMLGYDYARKTLDEMGYDYISFSDYHFTHDLQFEDAETMIERLIDTSKKKGLVFGLKLTNTFPVDVKKGELPSEEMYMSGRSLLPLSISLAYKLSKRFNGELPISYSGGIDNFNAIDILQSGIGPLTMATTALKPGGYARFKQLAENSEQILESISKKIDLDKLKSIKNEIMKDEKYHKSFREKIASRKTESKLEMFDCYKAPCKSGGCPIEQQIPEYLKLVSEEKYLRAIEVIGIDNTSPSILGSICSHPCQSKCTRVDYEESLQIRSMKKIASDKAQLKWIKNIKASPIESSAKVAIIGAGPVGIAAAVYLRRNGIGTRVFEKRDKPYGIVQYVIPEHRITSEDIEKDYEIAKAVGVDFIFNVDSLYNLNKMKEEYDYIIIATGAWGKGEYDIEDTENKVIDSIKYLYDSKNKEEYKLSGKIAVIGGGDVAMDCASLAKRQGAHVSIVYRRTESYMPAMQEDVNEVLKEGVMIKSLLSPLSYKDKILVCEKMMLGEYDESGRKSVMPTGEKLKLEFDSVIFATGAKIEVEDIKRNNINLDQRGKAILSEVLESNIENTFIIGDCRSGPSTIVSGMSDAKIVAKEILRREELEADFERIKLEVDEKALYNKRAVLEMSLKSHEEGNRCLNCDSICEMCVEVCPNRANIAIATSGFNNAHQILHIDGMCNECGNCAVFCPHSGKPYKDKMTLFWTKEDFDDSTNAGFLKLNNRKILLRTEDGRVINHIIGDEDIPKKFESYILTILNDYRYLLCKQ